MIYSCDGNGKILEHVYHDSLSNTGSHGDCSGHPLYTVEITNGCTEYFFGAVRMEWQHYCQGTPMTTTTAPPVTTRHLRTTTISPDICQVGDAVTARYPNGDTYHASIVSIHGDSITVKWSDGDPRHTVVPEKYVYKNGVCCAKNKGKLPPWGYPCACSPAC